MLLEKQKFDIGQITLMYSVYLEIISCVCFTLGVITIIQFFSIELIAF